MRLKRLYVEAQNMLSLQQSSKLIDVQMFGDPPEKYVVTYFCKGLIWLTGNQSPSISQRHQMEIYLHKDFPRTPPQLKWLTNIYHPNILPPDRNGGVCIGAWAPSETLDKLSVRIGEMIQYRNYNVKDPLNLEAAYWAAKNSSFFPVDNRDFVAEAKDNDKTFIVEL